MAVGIRIRGTFIDIVTTQLDFREQKRSRSAPLKPAEENEIDIVNDDDRLATWIHNATRINNRGRKIQAQRCAPEAVTHPRDWPRRNQCPKEVFCSCGAEFLPSALFCFQCGNAKQGGAQCATQISALEDAVMLDESQNFGVNNGKLPHSVSTYGEMSAVDDGFDQSDLDVATTFEDACGDKVADNITTLMICDIPCRIPISRVVGAIDDHGFANTYDLVYMPSVRGFQGTKHVRSMGYAFVNFKHPEDATAFSQAFQNYSFPNSCSTKLSYTKPARRQGFRANVKLHSKRESSSPGGLLTFP